LSGMRRDLWTMRRGLWAGRGNAGVRGCVPSLRRKLPKDDCLNACRNYEHIVAEPGSARFCEKSSVSDTWNYRIAALVAVTERERAYRYDFMRQFRERRVPNVFLEPSFSRGVSFSYNIIPCGGSEWQRNIKAPKTIHQQRSITSVRLTTIGKPPSIMKVELMKRRGTMPTWPMAMLAMQGTMRRKLVNITLRNMVRKNRLITVDEVSGAGIGVYVKPAARSLPRLIWSVTRKGGRIA
jgi:hypothetical protein